MGKTSSAAKNRWNAKNYDRINLIVKKGQKDLIKEYAEKNGESLNGFICRIISEEIGRDMNQKETE